MDGAGLYIHVPFCLRKCRYCDFYSVCDLSLLPRYTAALQREITARGATLQGQVDSVYFGGGTPSLLTPQTVAALLSAMRATFQVSHSAEATLEVNPGTVDAAQLKDYHDAGINRLSIGVQSFHDGELAFLGRMHTAAESRQVLHQARAAGYDNLGIDLIYAIPGQTADGWKANLAIALEFSPEHLSVYGLTFEPGTPLARDLDCGRIAPVDDRTTAEFYRITVASLVQAGYHQYEVSNFCRKQRYVSRHNRKYWNFEPYLGLGPAAHSFLPPQRCWNAANVRSYLQALESGRPAVADCETITRPQAMVEAVYLGLRQTRGIDPGWFQRRFQVDFGQRFGELTKRLSARGLMTFNAGRWALTIDGMLLLDRIAAEMVACLPDSPED